MNNSPYTEPILLRQFILGDEAAFRQVFLRQLNPLCYFAEKIIGQRQEAEDMVSAAFYKLWQRHADFSSLAGIRSFLYTTVRNQCFDHLKHRAVVDAAADRLPVQLSDAGIEARMYQAELLQLIYEGMEQLTAKHRHILQWSFLEELPTAEIASRLRMTETHVRVEKSRALVQLRQALRSKQRWQEALVLLAAWQLH